MHHVVTYSEKKCAYHDPWPRALRIHKQTNGYTSSIHS